MTGGGDGGEAGNTDSGAGRPQNAAPGADNADSVDAVSDEADDSSSSSVNADLQTASDDRAILGHAIGGGVAAGLLVILLAVLVYQSKIGCWTEGGGGAGDGRRGSDDPLRNQSPFVDLALEMVLAQGLLDGGVGSMAGAGTAARATAQASPYKFGRRGSSSSTDGAGKGGGDARTLLLEAGGIRVEMQAAAADGGSTNHGRGMVHGAGSPGVGGGNLPIMSNRTFGHPNGVSSAWAAMAGRQHELQEEPQAQQQQHHHQLPPRKNSYITAGDGGAITKKTGTVILNQRHPLASPTLRRQLPLGNRRLTVRESPPGVHGGGGMRAVPTSSVSIVVNEARQKHFVVGQNARRSSLQPRNVVVRPREIPSSALTTLEKIGTGNDGQSTSP